MNNNYFKKSTTESAVGAVYDCTFNYIKKNYGKNLSDEEISKKTDELLRIHGMSHDMYDPIAITERILEASNLNDESVDDNANKTEISVAAIQKESAIPFDKLGGFRYLYRRMKDDYGKEEAQRLCGRMYSFDIGINDSSKLLLMYCWSGDFTRLVTNGRDFGRLQSSKANRLQSYISALSDMIPEEANLIAGAIAVGTFFLDIAHLLLFEKDVVTKKSDPYSVLDKLRNDVRYRKIVENELQSFIYSINHASRDAVQSPFTNITILDRPKIENFVAPHKNKEGEMENGEYQWYYMNMENGEELDSSYVADVIEECQNIFLDVFDAGNPLLGNAPYDFPVVTVNVTKDENGNVVNEDFLQDFVSKRDIFRYNIFVGVGHKSAMCCYSGDESITIKENGKEKTILLKDFVESQGELTFERKDISEKNIKINDDLGNEETILGVQKLVNIHGRLIEIETSNGIIKATPDNIFKCYNKETDRIELVSASKILACGDTKGSIKYGFDDSEILSIKEVQSNEPVYDITMSGNRHLFKIGEGIGHNCRFMNDSELMEAAGDVNSFGAGGTVSLGSHRVTPLNTVRLAFLSNSKEDFKIRLQNTIHDAGKILKSHKQLIRDIQNKKKVNILLEKGWINLDRMFSTIGIIGIHETVERLKKYYSDDIDVMKDVLDTINSTMLEVSQELGIVMNLEEIPGESMSRRLPNADRILFGDEAIEEKLYSNQFIPLWKDVDVWNKIETEGKYLSALTGGGICHINIGEKTTPTQSLEIIKYAIKNGLEHFALNVVYSIFKDGTCLLGQFDEHPISGSKMIDQITRIVGFFTHTSTWNKDKLEYDYKLRDYKKI